MSENTAILIELAALSSKLDAVLAILTGGQRSEEARTFAAQVAQALKDRPATPSLRPGDAAALARILPAITDALPMNRGVIEFTVAQALNAPRLQHAVLAALGSGDAPRCLGNLLGRAESLTIGAHRVERTDRSSSPIVWRVSKL
jgi:hypothetical protein